MKTHLRTLTLCLTATFALAAFGASSASASKFEPEWGQCVATEGGSGGHYGNAGCTAKVKPYRGQYQGAYEWYPQEVNTGHGYGGELEDRISPAEQPVSSTTFTLADGYTITCQALNEQTKVKITGPHTTLQPPHIDFLGCQPTAPETGSSCVSSDAAEEREITTEGEVENYVHGEAHWWTGTLTVLEGKRTSDPVVGYVWKTSPARQRFFEQVNCEGGPVVSMVIGGNKENEAIITTIEPVNTMSASHTLSLGPLAHKVKGTKPLEALVNGAWQPITIKTTMLFPESEPECPQAELSLGLCNNNEEELKATP